MLVADLSMPHCGLDTDSLKVSMAFFQMLWNQISGSDFAAVVHSVSPQFDEKVQDLLAACGKSDA